MPYLFIKYLTILSLSYSNNLSSNPDVIITTPSLFDTMTGMMVFNDFEGDMYVTTDSPTGDVIRIDGATKKQMLSLFRRQSQKCVWFR